MYVSRNAKTGLMKHFIAMIFLFLSAATVKGQMFAVQVMPPLAFNYWARDYTQDHLGTSVAGGDVYILFLRKFTLQTTFFRNFKDILGTSSRPNIVNNASDSISYPHKNFIDNELVLTWNFFSTKKNKSKSRRETNLWKAAGIRGGFIENRRVMPVYTQQWEKYYGYHGWSTSAYGYDTFLYKAGTTNLSTSSFTLGFSAKTAYKKEKTLYALRSRTKDHNVISNNYSESGSIMRNILWEMYFDALHTTGLNYDDFIFKRALINVDPSTFDKFGWRVGLQRTVMNAFGTGFKIEFGNMPGQKKIPGNVEGSHSFGKNMYLQVGFTLSTGAI